MSTPPDQLPPTKPAILVIFGITGDLSHRKLLPALYHLCKDGLLDPHTAILGVSRRDMSVESLLETVEMCVLEQDNVCDPMVMADIRRRLHMQQLDPEKAEDYDALRQTLDQIETEAGVCMNRLYYLSLPPAVYPKAVEHLGTHDLATSCQHGKAEVRVLIEKPFGYDLQSAESLVEYTQKYFTETQIFRIDHYLAKESSQNIVTFRRHNPVFMDSWDGQHISRIEVLAHEKIGVEGRGDFYNQVGALRDLVQSHLMQLLALVMVDTGRSDDDIALHEAKRTVLESLSPPDVATTVRGQYAGYTNDIGQAQSRTETFVRLKLASSLPRWQGTEIVLETGKALRNKKTEIRLSFTEGGTPGNELTFRIQPNEGIDLQLTVKKPGFDRQLQKVSMDFSYHGAFAEPQHPEAYERVLVDAVRGDHHLFATSDEVLASWRALQPILDYWQAHDDFTLYEQGSDGPEEQGT